METRKGSCHCGAVAFTAEVDLSNIIACNCSLCGRSGMILTFVPNEAFTLEKGEDALTDYQFNKKHIHHTFCSTCGVRPFSNGTSPEGVSMYAINVRCIEGVDANELEPTKVDGKNM